MAVIRTRRNSSPRRRGLSLVEAIVSMAIVAVMLVMVLNTLGSLARARQVQAAQARGPALARLLMSEIVQCHYEEPDSAAQFGPESPETAYARAAYDDVDDYHGWSACPPEGKDGTALTGLPDWRRSVNVQYVDPDEVNSPVGSDQGLKRITVTVEDPRGHQTVLVGLRANGGVYDLRPQAETTYVTWAGVELQVGPDPQGRILYGANVLNQVATEP